MKIILLKDIPKIGKKYEVKNVADGYAHNFLIKNKLAEMATDSAVGKIEELRKKSEAERTAKEAEIVKKLSGMEAFVIEAKANEEGSLFAGIKKEDILKILKTHGIEVEEEDLLLDKAIKKTGDQEAVVMVEGKGHKIKFTIKAK